MGWNYIKQGYIIIYQIENFCNVKYRIYVDILLIFQDSTNKEIQLGVTSIGLVVFQNGIKINVFSWSKIVKISFKRKQFFIQLRREQVGFID